MDKIVDKRVYKTKANIMNAFKQLIETKRIEKITVKELADLSYINKTTFYRHFEDIYALVDHIENELVEKYNAGIDDFMYIFSNPKQYVISMTDSFVAQQPLSTYLVRHARKEVLFGKMADVQLQAIYKERPDLIDNYKFKISIEYLNGGLSSIGLDYFNNSNREEVYEVFGNIIKNTLLEFNQKSPKC